MAKLVALDGGDLYINLDMIESIQREPDPSHRNFTPDRLHAGVRETPMITVLTMQSGTRLRTDLLPADILKLGE
jgi:hypothetical protein